MSLELSCPACFHFDFLWDCRLQKELNLLLTDSPPLLSCTTLNRITRALSLSLSNSSQSDSPNPIPDGIQAQNPLHRQHRKVYRPGQRQGRRPHLLFDPRNYLSNPAKSKVQSPRELQGSGLKYLSLQVGEREGSEWEQGTTWNKQAHENVNVQGTRGRVTDHLKKLRLN